MAAARRAGRVAGSVTRSRFTSVPHSDETGVRVVREGSEGPRRSQGRSQTDWASRKTPHDRWLHNRLQDICTRDLHREIQLRAEEDVELWTRPHLHYRNPVTSPTHDAPRDSR